MPQRTLLFVVGARPNYMKVAPILRVMDPLSGFRNLLVHTGQHYDPELNDVFFQELEMRLPDIALGVGSGSHAEQTARLMSAFEPVVLSEAPDAVVVVGDVNSTLACSIVSAKLVVPVVHVEAGLRSFDLTMPEEINRLVTDRLASLLLTPSAEADTNLVAEGVAPERIKRVGNVMIDSLFQMLPRAQSGDTLARMALTPRAFVLLTLHRPSNVDDPETFSKICDALEEIQTQVPIVFPVHPRTMSRLRATGLLERIQSLPGIRIVPPLGYRDFICLESQAAAVISDSGGVQEETTALGVPCLTVRDNTERPITLSEGTNTLVGTSPERILDGWKRCRARAASPRRPEGWDGHAAERISQAIVEFLA